MPSPMLNAVRDEVVWMVSASRPPRVRSLREFAQDELVIPEGRFAGRKWRPERQPCGAAVFDLINTGPWRRRAFLGPVQSGKTLHCFVTPLLHYLFELRESVVVGVPTMDLAHSKWNEEILPVIERTRYSDLLPKRGAGSRGGSKLEEVRFGNGTTLKFMSGHGGDEKRSGFTARAVVATEVDKFDVASESSREADPISQLEARTDSYDDDAELNLECTVSIESGRIWTEYVNGTTSRMAHPCPHCGRLVSPDREHLIGWQDAETKQAARRAGYFVCPECRGRIDDAQRIAMVQRYRVVHRGQEITPDGRIVGEPVDVDTLGFRWSAFENLFWSIGKIAAREWAAARARDLDNAERLMRQFTWALPHEPEDVELTPLDPDIVARRQTGLRRGILPAGCRAVAVGVDTGKRMLHWLAIAVGGDSRRSVIDYGQQPVDPDGPGIKVGLIQALDSLRAYLAPGWQSCDGGPARTADQVWIDSGWHEHTDAVYDFCRKANDGIPRGSERWRPSKGFGEGQQGAGRYSRPKKKTNEIRHIGREFHLARLPRARQLIVHVNADHWKGDLRQGLAQEPDEAGAVLLFDVPSPSDHNELISQLTAEEPKEVRNKKGVPVVIWERIRRKNHYLDAGYAAAGACEFVLQLQAAHGAEGQARGWFDRQSGQKGRKP